MNAIEFDKVSFSYGKSENGDKVDVLKDFDMTVKQGSFVALLGRNGSGKSTLAKLVNGLLSPVAGKVTVMGLDTADKKNLF